MMAFGDASLFSIRVLIDSKNILTIPFSSFSYYDVLVHTDSLLYNRQYAKRNIAEKVYSINMLQYVPQLLMPFELIWYKTKGNGAFLCGIWKQQRRAV